MASLTDHTKIISRVAKTLFMSYGIRRRGQSRIWLDDHYWYTTVIEFQPFQGQQGTCLNVGANFHWSSQDYFSFDIGNRESGFVEFKNELEFEEHLTSLVKLAVSRTLDIRTKLGSVDSAEKTILSHTSASDSLWGNYHRAVFCGLNDKLDLARNYYDLIIGNDDEEFDWIKGLKKTAEQQRRLLLDESSFKNEITRVIGHTRSRKKLAEMEVQHVW